MEVVTILVSAMVGWFLGQANNYFERRDGRRRALCKTLSDLLFLRGRLIWQLYYVRNLAQRTLVPFNERGIVIAEIMDRMPLCDDRLSERYDAAVELLSEHYPIDATELKGKISSAKLMMDVQREGYRNANHPVLLKHMNALNEMMEKELIPILDSSLQRLALTINKRCYREVKSLLEQKAEDNQICNQWIDSVIEQQKELFEKIEGRASAGIDAFSSRISMQGSPDRNADQISGNDKGP